MTLRPHRKTVRMLNKGSDTCVCPDVEIADTFFSRFKGLLGRRSLSTGAGLWIKPSSGVHTFGMRFAIDVVVLDKDLHIIALTREMQPWHIAGASRKTRSILELPSGAIELTRLKVGDRLYPASI